VGILRFTERSASRLVEAVKVEKRRKDEVREQDLRTQVIVRPVFGTTGN
jgi:hypothetical protein